MRVQAVIPLYRPDPVLLHKVLHALLPQVEKCILYNNSGPDPALAKFTQFPNVTLIKPPDRANKGTAWVYNRGAERLSEDGVDAILLMDQDSVAGQGMVEALSVGLRSLLTRRQKVAAVGPRYRRSDADNLSGFICAKGGRLTAKVPNEEEESTECVFLIASGMLIPLASFEQVGPMDEDLFLDHVDTEWCFRAKSKGYRCYGIGHATMEHSIGTRSRSVWWGRRRNIAIHSPERYYWLARNSMILRKKDYMDRAWKSHDLKKLAGLMVLNLLTGHEGRRSVGMMLRGFKDGLHFQPSRHGSLQIRDVVKPKSG